MKCGKCKTTGVDTDHVRACYALQPVGPVEETESASEAPQAPPEPMVPVRRRQHTDPGRGRQTEGRAGLFVDLDDHALSYFGTGMDADGMTPGLRQLEDEYGYEGMLYLWRDDPSE